MAGVSSPTSQLHNACCGLNNDYIQWVHIEPFEHDFSTAKAQNDVYLWQSIQLFFSFEQKKIFYIINSHTTFAKK